MRPDFRVLAERLQKAREGSPALSEAVASWAKAAPVTIGCLCCDGEMEVTPPFTESLDAAMTLLTTGDGLRLEKDAPRSSNGNRGGVGWTASTGKGSTAFLARASTSALAVCAVAVMARGDWGYRWVGEQKNPIDAADPDHISDQDAGIRQMMAAGIIATIGHSISLGEDGQSLKIQHHEHLVSLANLCFDELIIALHRARQGRAA